MERGHIEFAQRQDLPWEVDELLPDLPETRFKTLSADPAGGFTRYVETDADWGGGPVEFDRPHEMYVLDGELRTGEYTLTDGGYVRIPAGRPVRIETSTTTRILWLTGIGSDDDRAPAGADTGVTVRDTDAMTWDDTFVPGPEPGLYIKLLWEDEDTGAYTRLIKAEAGWREHREEHHDCVEEIYTLDGSITEAKTGTLTPGAYVWRPPRVRHGPMHTDSGAVFFIRTDGPLVNHYTSTDGEALNYDGPPPESTSADGRSRPRPEGQT